VKGLTIFTKEGLKKITRNNSDFLGNGSFGKVYKGILPDDTIVAVKASIIINEDTRKDFTDEVEIQSNMIHKNILRLVGCCLEVEVPMLVYEFAANGSLQDILHQNKNQELPLDLRLDIAIGSAEGLKYMHSSTTQAIRHGDVKPDNILLDDKLTPKISDFGLSKLIKEGQFAKTVVGCMGYIDPVFLKTGLLTQKSDVYSFGAVLLELITGKKNVYDENQSLIIEFCKLYEKGNGGRAMFDKEIANEEDMFVLEEISKLAVECLCEDIEVRPDMTEVAERLVMLRRDKRLKNTLSTYGHLEDITMAGSPMQQRT
jgi:serine/threonine protein kinase